MKERNRFVHLGGTGEITEKKSRFIASIACCHSEEEAQSFIAENRKKYWDAKHHCYAYIIGTTPPSERFSDDGEPQKTAGKPMFDILKSEGLSDVCVVVSRYFGGTLLGTGGLVRAYQDAVKEGLSHCILLEKLSGILFTCTFDYKDAAKITNLAVCENIAVLDTVYTDSVSMTFLLQQDAFTSFLTAVTDLTAGKLTVTEKREVLYALGNGRPLLL